MSDTMVLELVCRCTATSTHVLGEDRESGEGQQQCEYSKG